MPPRKRARKNDQKPTKKATSPQLASSPAAAKPLIPSGSNLRPIFEVPNELWLEILSYFPSVRIPTMRIADTPVLPSSTLARQQALRTLSQTCHTFRNRFLPELWDRFEVCTTPGQIEAPNAVTEILFGPSEDEFDIEVYSAWYKDISRALERKSNGLSTSPELAKLVHKVSVVLTRCSAVTVLGAFVRCLHALPNLHTLQVLRAHTKMTTHLKNAFEGHKFPAVQTICLPDHAHNVLRSCPEVVNVICNNGDGSKLVSAIAKECKKVERLEGFRPDDKLMKRIIRAVPNMRQIQIGPNAEILDMLSSAKHLQYIKIETGLPSLEDAMKDADIIAGAKVAKRILREVRGSQLGLRGRAIRPWTTELKVSTS
ncbi:hypothetical protein D9615_010330 [Tricholomella constricta]|uniref:F-box domain-containing protein n=1 Tax=Tricholomella constricta TaxID=117010 RepID=A0A8H5GT58_9AGAR|nr:hypothetical protein D9615_010330 [Tricholomella constricta]